MKNIVLVLGAALTLAGCIQPDDLMPVHARATQQDLRRAPLMRVSCRKLQQQYIASDVPWAIISSAGGQLAQSREDLKVIMQKKGCRVPS